MLFHVDTLACVLQYASYLALVQLMPLNGNKHNVRGLRVLASLSLMKANKAAQTFGSYCLKCKIL